MTTLSEAKLLINGQMRAASGGKTYDNVNPWTGAVVGTAADASREDVNAAIEAARHAFDRTDWRTQHEMRYEVMKKYYALMVARKESFIEIARHEAGAAIGAAGRAHVDGALEAMKDLMSCFPAVKWQEDRGRKDTFGYQTERMIVHEALGVVGAITPWNVPMYVNVGKIACGLLAGCTMVLKPAPDTPLMGSFMGELAIEAGFPKGVLNVITSQDPAMAGEMLVTDPRVDVISFTGSTGIGKRIMEKGAPTLKRLFLELGGKSAWIVLDDEPNFAMMVASSMVVFHAGQGCATPTRLLVSRKRYAEAVEILKGSYAAYANKWGGVDDPTHVMGPVISKRQLERVMSYIEIGEKEGAKLLAGGKVRTDKGGGFFVEPTCFIDVKNSMRIAQEEIFGPVLVVIPYEDDEDAIRIANDSDYALGGYIFSGDKERGMRMARRVRAGAVGVNGGMCITGDLPFGGFKSSGMGREWGREGIEEFLDSKVIASRV